MDADSQSTRSGTPSWHRIGSLLPNTDADSHFLQIYFLDGAHQLTRRSSIYNDTNSDLLRLLQNYMNRHNNYVRQFKTALTVLQENPHTNLKVLHTSMI